MHIFCFRNFKDVALVWMIASGFSFNVVRAGRDEEGVFARGVRDLRIFLVKIFSVPKLVGIVICNLGVGGWELGVGNLRLEIIKRNGCVRNASFFIALFFIHIPFRINDGDEADFFGRDRLILIINQGNDFVFARDGGGLNVRGPDAVLVGVGILELGEDEALFDFFWFGFLGKRRFSRKNRI